MSRKVETIRHPYGGPVITGIRLGEGDRLVSTSVFASTDKSWAQNPLPYDIVTLGRTETIWVNPKPLPTAEQTLERGQERPEYRVIDVMHQSPEGMQEAVNQLHKEGYDYLDAIGPYLFFRKQEIAIDRESDRCGKCGNCVSAATYQKVTVPNFLETMPCQRPRTSTRSGN